MKVPHLDQCGIDRQACLGDSVLVALETLLGRGKISWATDATDPPVIPAYQMHGRERLGAGIAPAGNAHAWYGRA